MKWWRRWFWKSSSPKAQKAREQRKKPAPVSLKTQAQAQTMTKSPKKRGPKRTPKPVKTPVIDAHVERAEDRPDTFAELDKPVNSVVYPVYFHPFFVCLRTLRQAVVVLPFVAISYFLGPLYLSAVEQNILWAMVALWALVLLTSNYVYWRLNVTVLCPQTLEFFTYRGVLRFEHEEIELMRLNTFDMKRRGWMSLLFDVADIDLSTDASDQLTIRHAWRPDTALKVIKFYANKSNDLV